MWRWIAPRWLYRYQYLWQGAASLHRFGGNFTAVSFLRASAAPCDEYARFRPFQL